MAARDEHLVGTQSFHAKAVADFDSLFDVRARTSVWAVGVCARARASHKRAVRALCATCARRSTCASGSSARLATSDCRTRRTCARSSMPPAQLYSIMQPSGALESAPPAARSFNGGHKQQAARQPANHTMILRTMPRSWWPRRSSRTAQRTSPRRAASTSAPRRVRPAPGRGWPAPAHSRVAASHGILTIADACPRTVARVMGWECVDAAADFIRFDECVAGRPKPRPVRGQQHTVPLARPAQTRT